MRKFSMIMCAASLLISTGIEAMGASPMGGAGGRQVFSLNQNWEFFRPPQEAPFPMPANAVLAKGVFTVEGKAQTVTFSPVKVRYVCLESLSSHSGSFSSIAELNLLNSRKEAIARAKWRLVYATPYESASGDVPERAFDGKPDTFWHTAWKDNVQSFPHRCILDLGEAVEISGISYLPRQDGNSSGKINEWRLYGSLRPFAIPVASAQDPMTGKVAWETVHLPHSVRLEPLNASGGRNYQGVCWYRKTITPDPSWKGRKVYLRFEGAMQVADIWLNGRKITTHYGGYQEFVLDVGGNLLLGQKNTLLVRLDNSDNPEVPPGKPQGGLDFTYFGGLYRDVELVVTDRLHITDEMLAGKTAGGGIFVRYPEASAERAVVEVRTDILNEHADARVCQVRQELCDKDGKIVATVSENISLAAGASKALTQKLEVIRPNLWHPLHPYLYSLKTRIVAGGTEVDARTTRIGIRRIRFTPEGLFINGEKHFALGFNRHQDHPYVGYALPDSQHYRDARKMREAGFTSFRSHYPQGRAFMDACDELGILCVISNPGWQFFGNDVFVERTFQGAREMVRRDRNHPSAVIWEPFPNETQYPESYVRKIHGITHEEFPGDQCYVAGDPDIGNAGNYIEIFYGRKRTEGKPMWTREWGDSVDDWTEQQGRVRIARGWGEMPLLVQALNHLVKLNGLYQNSGGGPGQTVSSGAGLWAGIDCQRGYHHQPFLGGILDLFRIPKFDYYFFQSQRPPGFKTNAFDSGPMVFIANYATPSSPANVTVFSNCEEVRLYSNGKLVGTRKPDAGYIVAHPPFTFAIDKPDAEKSTYYMTSAEVDYHFKPSEYRAEGLIGGHVAAEHSVQGPGVMRRIILEADYAGRDLVADGGDWIRVYAKVCDRRGVTHPFADDLITFTVEGEGSVIGDDRIGANPVKAEAGIATALIRSTGRPGALKVRATAFGLDAGEIVIESKAPMKSSL